MCVSDEDDEGFLIEPTAFVEPSTGERLEAMQPGNRGNTKD